ncbi:hypothetical protein KFZ58_11345 [Virgibacillus sp. NKC19-16]|uniref:DUF6583 family protein n=1 Tax=Virgibacillus salidurans TaxID=2831673 RepID=UPI001F209701|nr:DUF6583 family protein [Virgibacillus sp. NKC19-16]UJL45016.1 hypothetical protein KFZ58_11345 [Virgibacillus sp. NKC19-16]
MGETVNNGEKKKGFSKGLIAIIITVVVVAGGSVAAFVLLNFSEKEQYFLAEKNSLEFMGEKMEERYQQELDWLEQSQETPMQQTVELAAEYNDPNEMSGIGTVSPSQIINNSTISITGASDMENEQASAEIQANIGGMEIDGFNFYVTAEDVTAGLPFMNELLQLKDEDFGSLMQQLDPNAFTGEENMNLESLFEGTDTFNEDIEYFQEEYGEMVYNELPDDAFESTDETIQVNDESLDTEKITFHLTEEQLKELITIVFEKMQQDDRIKEMMREQFVAGSMGTPAMEGEIDQFINEYETAIGDVVNGLEDFQIPDGLTSTIWIHDDVIAQRDFQVEMGPTGEELVSFSVNGTQLLRDANQTFNYDLGISDSSTDGTVNIAGDLSWEDNNATDSINLTVEDVTLAYEGTESLSDGTRDFDRTFSFDQAGSGGSLIWSGSSTYDNDQMNAEHNFSVESPEISQDMFALQVMTDSQTIDSVEMPSEEDVRDLGSMSETELMDFVELEVTPQFQQWLFGLMGGGPGFQ